MKKLTHSAIVPDPTGRGGNDGGEGAAKWRIGDGYEHNADGVRTFDELTQAHGVDWDQEMRARALEAEEIAAYTQRILESVCRGVGIPDWMVDPDIETTVRVERKVSGEAVTVTPQQPKPLPMRAPDADTNGQGSP